MGRLLPHFFFCCCLKKTRNIASVVLFAAHNRGETRGHGWHHRLLQGLQWAEKKVLLEELISDTQFLILLGVGEQWESVNIFLGSLKKQNKDLRIQLLKEWVFVLCAGQQGN